MKRLLFHMYVFFSRWADMFSSEKHLHTARFAKLHELTRIIADTCDGRHILIGEGSFNHVLAVKPTEKQDELGNILLDGKTRAGKGLNIESNLLTWRYPAIVNDIKRELHKRP